jgi:NifU-like protein involved in Fe-S cluster formation
VAVDELVSSRHLWSPHNCGALPGATHVGLAGKPGSGPYIRIYLQVEQETVICATYESNGCPSSIVCGSVLVEHCLHMKVSECIRFDEMLLEEWVGGLPAHKKYAAALAISALRNSLKEEKS